jgi:peroxiredoxin Q/BCP
MPASLKKTSTRSAAGKVAPSVKSSSASAAAASSTLPPVGKAAPAFSLPDDQGRKVSLKDFKGSPLVLYFYPKDSTPGCTTEACDFRDSFSRLKKLGAQVLGVSADSVASHGRFKEKQGLNFPLLSDESKEMLTRYGVWKEKSLYGRKFMGIERTTLVIDAEGKVAVHFPKVKVKGHVDAVIEALKAL